MISEVPLGAFLSGGIDSSSVVAMMAKNSTRAIKTLSIGFKEEKFNEMKYAQEVANKYGCEHHEEIVEAGSISLLPKLVSAYDEPFADPSAIPTYYVSKLSRQYVTVVLSGDGGDELFAGYNDYNKFKRINSSILHSKNEHINKVVWGNINKLIPEDMKGKGLTHFLSQNKEYVSAYISKWTSSERKKLLLKNDGQINCNLASEAYKKAILKQNPKHDFVMNMQYLDLKTYMVDDILTKVDRASMMNSLEVRVPLLDHKFAELTFKIPTSLKLKENSKKYIFKEAMKQFLPESILHHPKQGFGVPIKEWFKEDLKEYVCDTLLSSSSFTSRYVNQRYVANVVKNSLRGNRDFGIKIWSLIFFEEWLKQNKL
jgi:asparagine synthase (glutamine-hydrolysing)